MTTGVVRIGDTVRRPVGRWTPAVHSLLRHLEKVGFEGAPRVLGIDEKGREVLTYLPSDPTPSWSDQALVSVGDVDDRLALLDAVEAFQRDSLAEDLEFGPPEHFAVPDLP